MFIFYNSNFNTTNKIAPGSPNIPTKIAVIIFIPMWNWKLEPTILTSKIKTAPKIEFIINFIILISGTVKNLPNINKNIIHAK